MILNGQLTTTWRLFDDKHLTTFDEVEFVNKADLSVFGKARLTWVEEKQLQDISHLDKEGHETVPDGEEMYKHYEDMYHKPVNGETTVKVIKFELL